jgi:hypothetical protein
MAADPDFIDFISEYCDRWCERCPLRHKCASYAASQDPDELDDCAEAVEQAMEALRVELAMPPPPPRPWLDEAFNAPSPTRGELREARRAEEARRTRAEAHPAAVIAREYAIDAHTWIKLYADATRENAVSARERVGDASKAAVLRMETDAVLDALDVVRWDSMLIAAKLYRALRGKEDDAESIGEDPVQTDFNGSAKLTLLLTERSEAGWRLIARWAPESEIATQMAQTLAALHADIERVFPDARRFIRPGFDEPTR